MFAFGYKSRVKTISPLLRRSSISGYWPHFNHMPFQLIDIRQLFLFLINMFLRVGVFRLWCTGVVFMQPGVKVNGAYYCDVLLLKQLLPDICQAAGDFCFQARAPRVRKSTELLRHKTPDFTPDIVSSP